MMQGNGICYAQLESVGDVLTKRFPCRETLYGSWVSVNQSNSGVHNEPLQLCEV